MFGRVRKLEDRIEKLERSISMSNGRLYDAINYRTSMTVGDARWNLNFPLCDVIRAIVDYLGLELKFNPGAAASIKIEKKGRKR